MNKAPHTETRVYAEHERLHLVKDKSQAIGEFIDWLTQEKKLTIAQWGEDDWGDTRLRPAYIATEKLLAEYFDIDLDKLEKEKREMLAEMRMAHASNEIKKELGL